MIGRETHPEGVMKAGVVGVGYLGRIHAQKYAGLPGVRLVGVADVDAERARQIGLELGVGWYTDFRELLGLVNLLTISVPTQAHFAVASAALLAGIPVLLEKPMAASLAEADQLIELADRRGLVLQVGHLKRFHPAVVALRASGLVDSPRFIQSQRLAPFKNRALDVDVIMDLMIHDVDLILHWVDSPLVAVEAVGGSVVTEHLDFANARLRFADGCVAAMTASRVAPAMVRRVDIFQSDGQITVDFLDRRVLGRRRGAGLHHLEEFALSVPEYDTLEAEIGAFCEAVRRGCPPMVSGRDGRRALEVVTTIRQAMVGS